MWNQAGVYRRRRRTFTVSAALIVLLIIIASSSGGGSPTTHPATHSTPTVSVPTSSAPLTYTPATSLLAPIRVSAAAQSPTGLAILLLGGLDSAGSSTSGIATVSVTGTTITGELPASVDAAAAVELSGSVYLFGGEDDNVPTSRIYDYEVSGDGDVNVENEELPTANDGLSAAAIGDTIYIVGGYTGTETLDTILAWKPGSVPTVVGRLKQGLRYAAVAAVHGKLIIAGGLAANGIPSKQVFVFNPAKKKLRQLTDLPIPLYAASAVALGKLVYVIGGRPGEKMTPVTTIYSIDPSALTAQVGNAGLLPAPLAEESAAAVGNTAIYVAGGWNGTAPVASVGTLTLAAPTSKTKSKAG
jgi:N-acetylneuraminic acid mutarotase